MRDLMAGAVVESHVAHHAALHDPAGSEKASLSDDALEAVRALNKAGALALLQAMHQIVGAISPGVRGLQGGPLWVLVGMTHVQSDRPPPVHGG